MLHIEVLDVAENEITELPSEVAKLTSLKKLYLDNNQVRPSCAHAMEIARCRHSIWRWRSRVHCMVPQLATLPHSLAKLSQTLTMPSVANNPLEDLLMQQYLCGLPALLTYLKATRPRRSTRSQASSTSGSPLNASFDLFNTELPEYSAEGAS